MHLSVVIPAYNESSKILRDLNAAKRFLQAQTYTSEVLVVDDGSSDDTKRVVEEALSSLNDGKRVTFRLLSYAGNRGKGYAVKYGVLRARGEIIAFVDAGLCVPLIFLNRGRDLIRAGFDYAIASRRSPQATIMEEQPFYRRVGSQVFWLVVQGFMGVTVSDTQCGFKLFSREAAKKIFTGITTEGFMFDIEVLIRARKLGLIVAEFPIEWSNDKDTRYHPVWGTIRNFRELVQIRLKSLYES